MERILRNSLVAAILLCVLCLPQAAQAASVTEKGRAEVSPGVTRLEMEAKVGGRRHIVDVLRVDLANPYADLEVLTGPGGYTRRDSVSGMADRSDAYGAINGDFFNMSKQGAPFGPSVIGGKLQSSPLESIGLFGFGVDANRKGHIESFTFSGGAYAEDGASYPISGLNKTDYIINHTQVPSHKDSIQLYNDFWTSVSRGLAGSGEVMVSEDFVVEKISLDRPLAMAVPKGKYILQVNGRAKEFVRKHVRTGRRLKLDYRLSPDRNWRFLIGGHAMLVKNGTPLVYTLDAAAIDGRRARSAAGISADGKTVWLFATEGRSAKTPGMRLAEWAATAAALGCDRAINLDGGGSTTMVARGHGDFQNTVIARPEKGDAQRKITNAIGVMNRAPAGPLAGAEISGPRHVVRGEVATYGLAKAWDSYFHPVDPNHVGYSLTDTAFGPGAWVYSRFLSPQEGNTEVVLTTESGVEARLAVDVQSPHALAGFTAKHERRGDRLVVFPAGKTKAGRQIALDPAQIEWTAENIDVTVDTDSWKLPGAGVQPPAAVFDVSDLAGRAYGAVTATFGKHRAQVLLESPGYRKVKMVPGKNRYIVDGEAKTMDAVPVIKHDRTMVPLRFVMESFGAEVDWNQESRIATVFYKGRRITLPTDGTAPAIDGNPVTWDVGAYIATDRTMIPLRFVTEGLGMEVYYDPVERSVSTYDRP